MTRHHIKQQRKTMLVLGGDGMLGHKLFQILSPRFNVVPTFRHADGRWRDVPLFHNLESAVTGLDARNMDSVARALAEVRPDVVVNAIGVIKQASAGQDPVLTITTNALFPHRLATLCLAAGIRMIHVSTDCVFSGKRGCYRESDMPDPEDLYGRSKLLGEVGLPGVLTLRSSIIGRELSRSTGLLEWFLSNRGGTVQGWTNHIFTGFTTTAMAQLIGELVDHQSQISGLYHVASSPIDKASLLHAIGKACALDIAIEDRAVAPCDRSLDGSRFVRDTGIIPPDWSTMIADLATDPTPYDQWRTSHGDNS